MKKTRTSCLVHETESIGVIATSLQCADVVVFRTLENLSERSEVHTKGHWSVTSVVLETLLFDVDGDEGDMGVIHSLELLGRVRQRELERV